MPTSPIMKEYPSGLNMALLCSQAILLPTIKDDGNLDMAYNQHAPITKQVPPTLFEAALEIRRIIGLPAVSIMVNTLQPGQCIPPHVDTVREDVTLQRFHLPLQTNPFCLWWDQFNGYVHMRQGYWIGPVPFHIRHCAVNPTAEPRVHITVDLIERGGDIWKEEQKRLGHQ